MFLATVDSGGGVGPPSDDNDALMGQSALPFSSQLSTALSTALNSAQDMDSAMLYSIASLGSDPQLQSPALYTKPTVISNHQTAAPQAPQTPTSIPDIILTGTDIISFSFFFPLNSFIIVLNMFFIVFK